MQNAGNIANFAKQKSTNAKRVWKLFKQELMANGTIASFGHLQLQQAIKSYDSIKLKFHHGFNE